MANQLGHPGVSPREYSRHRRHAKLSQQRHSPQAQAFEAAEATRFAGGVTDANIFTKLFKYTAAQIKAAATYAGLT